MKGNEMLVMTSPVNSLEKMESERERNFSYDFASELTGMQE